MFEYQDKSQGEHDNRISLDKTTVRILVDSREESGR